MNVEYDARSFGANLEIRPLPDTISPKSPHLACTPRAPLTNNYHKFHKSLESVKYFLV